VTTRPSPSERDIEPAPKGTTDAPSDERTTEIAHRTRLLSTVGYLLAAVGILYVLVEFALVAFAGWAPPPWTDFLLNGLMVLAGVLMVLFVRSGRLSLASWVLLSLFLIGSSAQFCIEGRSPSESAGRLALLVAVALAFVLLRRGAWVVLALSVMIVLVMHLLWVVGSLPPAVPRDEFSQAVFSMTTWLAAVAALTSVLYSTMNTLRDQARVLRQRVRDLTLLHRTGNRIAARLDPDDLMQVAVQSLHHTFEYDSAAIFTVHSERRLLQTRAIAGRLAACAVNTLIAVNDVESDPRYLVRYPDRIHTRSELCVPIQIGGDVVGILDVQSDQRGAFNHSDLRTMEILASQVAVAEENARLYEAERSARQQLRDLVSYVQSAREDERTHIAREILDEFGQLMAALQMDLSWLNQRLPTDDRQVRERTTTMSNVIDQSLKVVQRLSSQLRPSVLDHFGLAAAIRWQAETFSERTGISHRLALEEGSDALDRELSTTLFRILQEALSNVEHHARGQAVAVGLSMDPEQVTLVVADDGRGITPEHIVGPSAMGLADMRERAHALGGDVTIQGVPGRGTTVTATIPRTRPAPRP